MHRQRRHRQRQGHRLSDGRYARIASAKATLPAPMDGANACRRRGSVLPPAGVVATVATVTRPLPMLDVGTCLPACLPACLRACCVASAFRVDADSFVVCLYVLSPACVSVCVSSCVASAVVCSDAVCRLCTTTNRQCLHTRLPSAGTRMSFRLLDRHVLMRALLCFAVPYSDDSLGHYV